MQALNDWQSPEMAPWPPPTLDSGPTTLTRSKLWWGIFARCVALSILGGMGLGALCIIGYGPVAVVAIVMGGMIGVPLGLGAGVVLATVGVLVLRPYRGPAIPIVTISVIASTLVAAYLAYGLHAMAVIGESEGGPATGDGTSWDWLLITAWFAAAFLSPYVVWWYLKLIDPSFATGRGDEHE